MLNKSSFPFLENSTFKSLLRVVQWLALVLWLGTSYSISLWILPQVFKNFPRILAGPFAGHILQIYFLVSILCLALIMILHAVQNPWEGRSARTKTILLFVCALCLAFNLFVASPKIHALRNDSDPISVEKIKMPPQYSASFRKWHGASMAANLLVLLAGIPLIVLTALKK